MIGMVGLDKVLDAGCGFGQWSMALSRLNNNVIAVDVDMNRLNILEDIRNAKNAGNIEIVHSPLEKMAIGDEYCDGVLCYGALFCTDWKKTVREIARVTKKGGIIYLNANGVGWYLHLWLNRYNEINGYSPRHYAAKTFLNTIEYEMSKKYAPQYGDIIIERDDLLMEIENNGLTMIACGDEGTVNIHADKAKITPFFKGEYNGLPGTYELLAKR
jgi:ubiquinone/menaquinone biosynthesis C-methylase UbiE